MLEGTTYLHVFKVSVNILENKRVIKLLKRGGKLHFYAPIGALVHHKGGRRSEFYMYDIHTYT